MSRSMKSISRSPMSHVFSPLVRSGFFIFLALFALPAVAEFAGGDGSPGDPFQVETAEHLNAVRNHMNAHFIQIADIDLDVAPWNEGAGWSPIGYHFAWNNWDYFGGHYDGQGHTISGLFINRTRNYVGLFGRTSSSATIMNLGVINVDISANGYAVGGLVGRLDGDLHNVYVTGSVSGNDSTGGLVGGTADGASITESFADVTVSGVNDVGGLIGYLNWYASVTHSFSSSTVDGNDNVGGLVGHHRWGSSVLHCYATGSVSGGDRVGGLVGYYSRESVTTGTVRFSHASGEVEGTGDHVGGLIGYADGGRRVISSFWDVETTGQAYSGGGKGIATAAMQSIATFANAGWGEHDWVMEAGEYPRLAWEDPAIDPLPDPEPVALSGSGTAADPFLVTTAAEFAALSWHVGVLDKHIELDADIDLTGLDIYPIGDLGDFSGVFDGAGYEISNASILQPGASFVGLFARMGASGVIRAVDLRAVEVSGTRNVGGLIGSSGSGTLHSNTVIGTVTGTDYVGGMAGYSGRAPLDCAAEGEVTGTEDYVGGLIGYLYNGDANNCFANVNVTGRNRVGGLVGYVYRWIMQNSHSTGEVRGRSYVGGLVGQLDYLAGVENCFATGDVIATGNRVGGLLGDFDRGRVRYNYATGNVSGSTNVGGLVGYSHGTVRSSFARGDVHGNESVGGLVGSAANHGVENSYATGAVSGDENIGGLIGYHGQSEVSHSYAMGLITGTNYVGGLVGRSGYALSARVIGGLWDVETSAQADSANGMGLASEEMKSVSTIRNAGWGDSDWVMVEGEYPRLFWEDTGFDPVPAPTAVPLAGSGDAEDPYRITNADDFIVLSRHVGVIDKHIQLDGDVNLDGRAVQPIGLLGDFTGVFDGGGHSIMNLEIDRPAAKDVGLFAFVGANGVIQRVGLDDADISGYQKVGGLVGYNRGGIADSYVSGSVRGVNSVGGLIGENGGSISYAFSEASVAGHYEVGGLVGHNYGSGNYVGAVSASYASGDVTASGQRCGGLIGRNDRGVVQNSYASGAVHGDRYVGGLIGFFGWSSQGTVTHCYSVGAVTGNTDRGGLVGFRAGTVTRSYWNTETSGRATSAGGTGRTTDEMTYPYDSDTYVDWDFAAFWADDETDTINAGYPYLAYTLAYEAELGGQLLGTLLQRVALGDSSEAIEVVPDAGAEFVGWSDGSDANPRIDGRLTGSVHVSAHFRSVGGVDMDWYTTHAIEPGAGETWEDVDQRYDVDKRMTLAEQYVADLDPDDPTDVFEIEEMPFDEGLTFNFRSSANRVYTLEATSDLKDEQSWEPVPGAGPRAGVGGPDSFTDANETPTGTNYRLTVALPEPE